MNDVIEFGCSLLIILQLFCHMYILVGIVITKWETYVKIRRHPVFFCRKECFCGNEDLPLQMKASDKMCGMACTGDPKLKCGDYLYVSIYQTGLASE